MQGTPALPPQRPLAELHVRADPESSVSAGDRADGFVNLLALSRAYLTTNTQVNCAFMHTHLPHRYKAIAYSHTHTDARMHT